MIRLAGHWTSPWPWLGVYAALLLVIALQPANPRIVGLYHDDGTYWSLGTAILHGSYRDPHSPEPIQIAKYPPGVPLLAAVAQALAGGDLVLGVSLLRALYVVLFVLTLGGCWIYMRREGNHVARAAPFAVAAVALSPWFLDFMQLPMSEIPALFVVMLTLVRLTRPESDDSVREGVILGELCFLAVLFRSMMVTLAGTVLVYLLLSRRRRTALWFVAAFAPLFVALTAFMFVQERPAAGYEDITVYGRPYGGLLRENLHHAIHLLRVNLRQSLLFVAGACFPGLVSAGYPTGDEIPWLWWGVGFVTFVLLLGGRVQARRRGARGANLLRPHRLLLLFNLMIILVWPFESYRFWAFLLPFLLMTLLQGAGLLLGRWGVRVVGTVAVLTAVMAAVPARIVRTRDAYAFGESKYSLRSTYDALVHLPDVLPKGAVVASTRDTLLGAHLGVVGVDGWVTNQLFERYYGPERRGRAFYLGADTRSLVTALFAAYPEVLEQYRRLGVTHVVHFGEVGDRVVGSLLLSLVARLEQEGRAELVYETADQDVRVWRIEP